MKDIVGLFELAQFAFPSLHLLDLFGRDASALIRIDFNPFGSLVQHLWCATALR